MKIFTTEWGNCPPHLTNNSSTVNQVDDQVGSNLDLSNHLRLMILLFPNKALCHKRWGSYARNCFHILVKVIDIKKTVAITKQNKTTKNTHTSLRTKIKANVGRTSFQKYIRNVNMYCALALGINPKHFILATLFDTKHSVLPLYILSSLFDSHERERKVVATAVGSLPRAFCIALFHNCSLTLSPSCHLTELQSLFFLAVLIFSLSLKF